MDPLSITVSTIALIGATRKTVKTLHKLRSLAAAPDTLLSLSNEVADLSLLLDAIHELLERSSQPPPSPVSPSNDDDDAAPPPAAARALAGPIARATRAIAATDALLARALQPDSNPAGTHAQPPRISKLTFLRMESRLRAQRDDLRDARAALGTGLAALSACGVVEVRARLRVVQLSSSTVGPAVTAAPHHDGMTDAAAADDDAQTCVRIAAAPDPPRRCTRACACACHAATRLSTPPPAATAVLGVLFASFTGGPAPRAACTQPGRCRAAPARAAATYFFPRWLCAAAVRLVATWPTLGPPTLTLRALRVVDDRSAVFARARAGDLAGVQALFGAGRASPIDVCLANGRTPLHCAIYGGQVAMAAWLVGQRADPGVEDKYRVSCVAAAWETRLRGKPALDPAAMVPSSGSFGGRGEGEDEVDDFLASRNLTPLQRIVLRLNTSVSLAGLLSLRCAPLDATDADGRTALHWACVSGDEPAVRALLAAGASPHVFRKGFYAPLHQAVESCAVGVVAALVDAGAETEARSFRGDTPLGIAALWHADTACAAVLVAAGADVAARNGKGESLALRAVFADHEVFLAWLVGVGADVRVPDGRGVTPLRRAVQRRAVGCLRLLLRLGCGVGDEQREGEATVLHDAAAWAGEGVLDVLCGAAAEGRLDVRPDAVDVEGDTAGDVFARRCGEEEAVEGECAALFERLVETLRGEDKFVDAAETLCS